MIRFCNLLITCICFYLTDIFVDATCICNLILLKMSAVNQILKVKKLSRIFLTLISSYPSSEKDLYSLTKEYLSIQFPLLPNFAWLFGFLKIIQLCFPSYQIYILYALNFLLPLNDENL